MAKAGRSPLSDTQLQDRIDAYCARYNVKERNHEGFPVFPAGQRETEQHRKWIALYKVFSRARQRLNVTTPPRNVEGPTLCPVCLQPGFPTDPAHERCSSAVALAKELGRPVLDRIARAAFPDPVRARRSRG